MCVLASISKDAFLGFAISCCVLIVVCQNFDHLIRDVNSWRNPGSILDYDVKSFSLRDLLNGFISFSQDSGGQFVLPGLNIFLKRSLTTLQQNIQFIQLVFFDSTLVVRQGASFFGQIFLFANQLR